MVVISMVVSKQINTKKTFKFKSIWAIGLIIIGILLSLFEIGIEGFLGFPSIGIFLIYIGIIGIVITLIPMISNKKKIIDERAEHIGYKASRVTTLALIITLFLTVVIDGINTITVPYYLYASFLTCFYVICYLLSYKIIELNN